MGPVAGPVRLLARGAAVASTSTAATRPQDQAHLLNRTTCKTGPPIGQNHKWDRPINKTGLLLYGARSSDRTGPPSWWVHLQGRFTYMTGPPRRVSTFHKIGSPTRRSPTRRSPTRQTTYRTGPQKGQAHL